MNNAQIHWRVLALLWLVLLVLFSASISLGIADRQWEWVRQTLGGDLVTHGVFAMLLSFLAIMALPTWMSRGYCLRMVNPLLLLLAVMCLLEESIQYWLPRREFSWLDIVASLAGLVAGNIIAQAWHFVCPPPE